MIPQIGSGLSRSVLGVGAVAVPPPLRFKPLRGKLREVRRRGTWGSKVAGTLAQKAGVRYEIKAQRFLTTNIPGYQASVQFTFKDEGGFRSIIPDGYLLYDGGPTEACLGTGAPTSGRSTEGLGPGAQTSAQIAIFEIKSQHMPEAWWQLQHLYGPVLYQWLAAQNRKPHIRLVEVCRSYDPMMPFPTAEIEIVKNVEELRAALAAPDDRFIIFEYRP